MHILACLYHFWLRIYRMFCIYTLWVLKYPIRFHIVCGSAERAHICPRKQTGASHDASIHFYESKRELMVIFQFWYPLSKEHEAKCNIKLLRNIQYLKQTDQKIVIWITLNFSKIILLVIIAFLCFWRYFYILSLWHRDQ